jgi:hypothetical protein
MELCQDNIQKSLGTVLFSNGARVKTRPLDQSSKILLHALVSSHPDALQKGSNQ